MSMGIAQMNSLLASQNTLKGLGGLNAARASVNGQSRILSGEIKLDKDRGLNTAKQEEALAEMEERLESITESISDSMTELNERIAADNERIREEEAAREAEKTKKAASGAAAARPGAGGDIQADASAGIAEPVDEVTLSPEGKAAAAAHLERAASAPRSPETRE